MSSPNSLLLMCKLQDSRILATSAQGMKSLSRKPRAPASASNLHTVYCVGGWAEPSSIVPVCHRATNNKSQHSSPIPQPTSSQEISPKTALFAHVIIWADHLRFLLPVGLLEPPSVFPATLSLETDPLSQNVRSPFSALVSPPLPFPLSPLPCWLIPFSRSLCLEFPTLQLWDASEMALGGLRYPWLL
ncbi:hypothetical protein ILYODFUR_011179 [Ilyodon furcidens]|uniref:Uncharacterized protein n=1 Tax=Ilyodon furcidens TaxID=33524 RepID=A0ABV0UTR9_9TELE